MLVNKLKNTYSYEEGARPVIASCKVRKNLSMRTRFAIEKSRNNS